MKSGALEGAAYLIPEVLWKDAVSLRVELHGKPKHRLCL